MSSELIPPPEIPQPSWADLGLSPASLEILAKAGFQAPTPVQALSIPEGLQGRDLIVSAQTGTGKTASFVLPMVEKLEGRNGLYGLILAPTREIAQQIQATIDLFGVPRGVRAATLIGGIDMRIDLKALQTHPQIIVATPGRLCDHIQRGTIWIEFIEMVVLDEADRMLDMGFAQQLSIIFDQLPQERQTLLFSATIPGSIEQLGKRILKDPKRIMAAKALATTTSVEQRMVMMDDGSKRSELRRLLSEEPGSVMVFVRSKIGAAKLMRSLHSDGF